MGDQLSHKIQKSLKLFSFCFLTYLHAEPTPYFSVYNAAPKYDIHAKHFDYVNPNAPKQGVLKTAIVSTFDNLNPFSIMGTSTPYISIFCFARLFDDSQDEVSVSYPYAAKSIEISHDKKSITFYLNETAKFSDGSPITADDVVWSFNFLIKINPMMKQYYKDIIKVEAVNQHTILFYSKNPHNKELPYILGQIYIFHSRFFKEHMNERGVITKPFPVSGPYQIHTADWGRIIIFERVKNWWGENLLVNKGLYNFDTVELQFFKEKNAAFQAFLAGDVNLWIEAAAKQWHTGYDVAAVKDGKIIKTIIPSDAYQATKGFAFNLRRQKFQDIRTRKAISLLFNFESINKALFYNEYFRLNSYFGKAELSHQGTPQENELKILLPYKNKVPAEVFGPSFKNPVYTDDFIPRETLQQALDLLKEAGWKLKNQILTNKNNEAFEFNFLYTDSSLEKIILHLQRNLAVAGIKLIPKQVDASTYTEMVDQFDFDMIMLSIAQSHSLGNEQREFFGSKSAHIKGARNLAGIENPVIDELIEKLIAAKDYQSMLDHAHAIDRILCWNYYIVMNWDFSGIRTAYWNQFATPEKSPKYSPFPILSWYTKDIDQSTPHEQSLFSKISQIIKDWFS